MEASNKKTILLGAATIAAIISAGVLVMSGDEPEKPAKEAVTVKAGRKPAKTKLSRPATRREAKIRKAFSEDRRPDLDFTDAELASISPELRKILEDLQNAVDAEDAQTVSKLSEKILVTMRKFGEDSVPPFVREAAVDAIGFFLPGSLADLVGFMKDSDPDVLQEVMDKFSDAIDDPSLGDRELAAILVSVSSILTNEDAIESLFMSVENDMRNSVAVETYLTLWETGTEAIKSKIVESISDFTGEDDIETPEQLEKWLEENPDDEDDGETYAGEPDDPDDPDDDGEPDDPDDDDGEEDGD